MRTHLNPFFAIALLAPSTISAQDIPMARYQPPPGLADGWKTATPDSLRADPNVVCKEIVMALQRKGRRE